MLFIPLCNSQLLGLQRTCITGNFLSFFFKCLNLLDVLSLNLGTRNSLHQSLGVLFVASVNHPSAVL